MGSWIWAPSYVFWDGVNFLERISFRRVVVLSPKIVIKFPRTYKKLHCKEEPYQFSCYRDPLVMTDRLKSFIILIWVYIKVKFNSKFKNCELYSVFFLWELFWKQSYPTYSYQNLMINGLFSSFFKGNYETTKKLQFLLKKYSKVEN